MCKHKHFWQVLLFSLLLLLFSCDMGASIYTDEELTSMYHISLKQDSVVVSSKNILASGSSLSLSVESEDNAPDVYKAVVELASSSGESVASLQYQIEGVDKVDTEDVIIVNSIDSAVQNFQLPEDLPFGYYVLTVSLFDYKNSSLAKRTLIILVYDDNLSIDSLIAYPATVYTNSTALLKMEITSSSVQNPWIVWSINDIVVNSGFLSDKADRFVWSTPQDSGIYFVSAEIYPFEPPSSYQVEACAKIQIKVPVTQNTASVSDVDSSWVHFPFSKDLYDEGPRKADTEIAVTGSYYPETFSTDYGFMVEDGFGLLSNDLMPELKSNSLSMSFSFVPKSSSGNILRVYNKDKSLAFSFAVDNNKPQITVNNIVYSIPYELSLEHTKLALSFSKAKDKATVLVYADDVMVYATAVDSSVFDLAKKDCVFVGDSGFIAIYDDLSISSKPYDFYYNWQSTSDYSSLDDVYLTKEPIISGSDIDVLFGAPLVKNTFVQLSDSEEISISPTFLMHFVTSNAYASVAIDAGEIELDADGNFVLSENLYSKNAVVLSEDYIFTTTFLNVISSLKNTLDLTVVLEDIQSGKQEIIYLSHSYIKDVLFSVNNTVTTSIN